MINAPCAYQVVNSFSQWELCLSKQVRGRGLFITVKVADTDQESINLPLLPPTHHHLCPRCPWLVSSATDWRQVNLQVLWFPRLRTEICKNERVIKAASKVVHPVSVQAPPRPLLTPSEETFTSLVLRWSAKVNHHISFGVIPPGNMGAMTRATFSSSIKLDDFRIKWKMSH